jgi:hypothetical protein
LEYNIRRDKQNQEGLKLNRTQQLSAYTDINIVEEDIDTMKRNTEAFLDASKMVGLEEQPQKIKYILILLREEV